MKTTLLCGALIAASFASLDCSKSTTTSANVVVTCFLSKSIEVRTDSSATASDSTFYTYNAANLLIRAANSYSYDTLIYVGGKISRRLTIGTSNASVVGSDTYTYAYSGDNLTQIVDSGTDGAATHVKTTRITWIGGAITDIATSGGSDGKNQHLTNITWAGGNIATLDFDPTGLGTFIHLSAVFDAKTANKSVPPKEGGDFLEYFSTNNLASVATTADANIGGQSIPAGTKLIDRALTYTADGNVLVRTEYPTLLDATLKVTTMTYDCK